ncbi:hypothetical protein M2432_001458 [Mycobacterium sp. OTB74]|jgi:hypothetical protein|nr:hypothetical protein [Mycobacterium sp. OTB74]
MVVPGQDTRGVQGTAGRQLGDLECRFAPVGINQLRVGHSLLPVAIPRYCLHTQRLLSDQESHYLFRFESFEPVRNGMH